jgi:hypothetical protein
MSRFVVCRDALLIYRKLKRGSSVKDVPKYEKSDNWHLSCQLIRQENLLLSKEN